jgi:hypothetical protein
MALNTTTQMTMNDSLLSAAVSSFLPSFLPSFLVPFFFLANWQKGEKR